jgi:hypothetical protein
LKDLDQDELDDLEELDMEDDRELEHYRRLRMKEMVDQSLKDVFGGFQEISKTDYPIQVTGKGLHDIAIIAVIINYTALGSHLATLPSSSNTA